ncbi:hypothetical protein JRQ81_010329 [Phrynocephalus forsythii]|uniref:WKF domain-containing protein n=1 Tax=Phrynocephalus forsythii TaxID=171643 RepID=A0A9Q0X8X2_9SAUR|nr:hypothetical protein JRQ81_010329 [Phrynocephalus forsythii]
MVNKRKTPDSSVEKKKKMKSFMIGKKKVTKKKMKCLLSETGQQVYEPEVKKQKLEVAFYSSVLQEEEDKDEDLTPEEKRILERKLKKERKKEQKKLMREAGIIAKKEESKKPSAYELALDYLTTWSESPKEWRFQKTRQTWLLLHMYDKDKVPDKYFSILLRYLEGLQGHARDITVQKAEALMKDYDNSEREEDSSFLEKCERIRQVLQLLS